MFSHRNHLRRWAARVLAIWLIGAVVGMANACVVRDLAEHGAHGAMAVVTAAGHHHGHGLGHSERPDGLAQPQDEGPPSPDGSFAQANCKDFCAKVAVSIAPTKSAPDDVQGHAAPPSATTLALPVPVLLPVQKWVPRRDGSSAPPVPIAFLRLAL